MSDAFRIAAVSYRALHLKYCALHEEMQVMSDNFNCALLEIAMLKNEYIKRSGWVGLTGDEIDDLPKGGTWWGTIRAAETILKEKNGG